MELSPLHFHSLGEAAPGHVSEMPFQLHVILTWTKLGLSLAKLSKIFAGSPAEVPESARK